MATPRVDLKDQPDPMPKTRVLNRKESPWDDAYHLIYGASWPRFLLLVAGAYVALNLAFGAVYALSPGAIANARPGSFYDGFFFSVQTLATIGYGGMLPQTTWGHVLVTFEAFVGVLFIAMLTGLVFGKFSRPRARVMFARQAVIGPRNGVPHLQFRLANFRHNLVVDASLRVLLLRTEVTQEGERMLVPRELPLVRERTSLFMMTWTPMHRIDETSPFHGEGKLDELRAEGAELFLSLTGLDDTVAQTIHARYRYRVDQVVPNARFVDALSVLEDGTRKIDYAKFHEIARLDRPE